MYLRSVLPFLLVIAIASAAGHAQTVPPATDAGEQVARQIESELIAPCCWSQQVSLHESPATTEIRLDIRRRLNAGQTHDEVLDAYVAQYGQRILAVPEASGFNYLLFTLPPLLFLVTAVFVVLFVRKASRKGQATLAIAPVVARTNTRQYDQQLDDELRDLD